MTPPAGRIVITGAGGQVGTALTAAAGRQGRAVLALTSTQWDITDASAAERIIERDDVVVNCAAYTDVDGAESDEPARLRGQRDRPRTPGPVLREGRRPIGAHLH